MEKTFPASCELTLAWATASSEEAVFGTFPFERFRRTSPRLTYKVEAVDSEAAVDAKSLSSWEVSDPVRFRLECGASTSESFPAGDVQTGSLKVIQSLSLNSLLLIGPRHG